MPMGATTSKVRVTLLSLLRQTDEFIVAIATKRPAPKNKGNWTVFTQLLTQVPFPTWFYRRVCVCACACARRHRAPQDTGAPSRSHSCNPSGSPALKSLRLAP